MRLAVLLAAALLAPPAPSAVSGPGGASEAPPTARPPISSPPGAGPTAHASPAVAAPGWAPPTDTLSLEDDLGRTVVLPGPPERIVSLIPPATEILFAIGAGPRVVGRTRYGTHPPAAAEAPSVGAGMRPSLEMVMDRRPDAVVLYAGSANRSTVDRLASLGVPALAVRHDTFGDLYRNIRRLGRLTGREAAARRLVQDLRCRMRAVASLTAEAPPRRVYYEVWSEPPITVGAGSYLDSLLTVAGGRNVFGDLDAPSPQVSLESVVSRDPEIVVVPRRAGEEVPTPPSHRPGWDALEAVREGRVRQVDGDLVHRLGPRIAEGALALARTLHPDLAGRLTREALVETCGAGVALPADTAAVGPRDHPSGGTTVRGAAGRHPRRVVPARRGA